VDFTCTNLVQHQTAIHVIVEMEERTIQQVSQVPPLYHLHQVL